MLKLFNAGFSKWQLFAIDFPVRKTQLKVKAWPKTVRTFLPLSLSVLSLSRRERERSEGAGRERPRTSENQANLTLEQFSFRRKQEKIAFNSSAKTPITSNYGGARHAH